MTDENLFDDLKQFITAQSSQLEERLRIEINALKGDVKTLDEKMDLIQEAIAETMTHHQAVTRARLDDHEQHLSRLEHGSV